MKCLGIDVGGTFTDFVLYDEETGEIALEKLPSTPADHSEGMIRGVERLQLRMEALAKFVHGTTVATNTALERNGAKVGIVVTRGFRDVLTVGRGNRTSLYNVRATRGPPLVPRSLCLEVDERTLFDGTILRDVDVDRVKELAERLSVAGIESVAVCFLHSYANNANEQATVRALNQHAPGLLTSSSSDVLAEFREFERFATTAVNAYVAPRMRRYLSALEERMQDRGYSKRIQIMTSNGGTISTTRAMELPVQTMLSGPAGGVIGAVHVCAASGYPNFITCDMGGTSTDVCLVENSKYQMTNEGAVGDLPNRTLQIEINSVGAGGGSIATVDGSGFLTVGPQSAGARPGPACYGHGGTAPTVTDANLALSRLSPSRLLGGEIRLDPIKASASIRPLADALGISVATMAEGIVKLAVTRMTGAIKEISVMRGYDPRTFALFAFGGAGPLHAAAIAEELGIETVIVPPIPGNFSAFGLLVADSRQDVVQTRLTPLAGTSMPEVQGLLDEMKQRARTHLLDEGFSDSTIRYMVRLDMRFVGQAFELPVHVPETPASIEEIKQEFVAAYERRYAYVAHDPIEIVNFRVSGYGTAKKPPLPKRVHKPRSMADAVLERRSVVFDGAPIETPVYGRDLLPENERVNGPAIIDEDGSTTVIPPGLTAFIDDHLNLIMRRGT